MSAGPSFAPKSTFGFSRANTSVGSSTPVVRQWGMAIPPGRPVAEVASRARASSASWLDIGRATHVARDPREGADHVVLVGPEICVETHQIRSDQVGHRHPPRLRSSSRTETCSDLTCEGWGMVVPGSPAAALP